MIESSTGWVTWRIKSAGIEFQIKDHQEVKLWKFLSKYVVYGKRLHHSRRDWEEKSMCAIKDTILCFFDTVFCTHYCVLVEILSARLLVFLHQIGNFFPNLSPFVSLSMTAWAACLLSSLLVSIQFYWVVVGEVSTADSAVPHTVSVRTWCK